ncbi:hypothetical protein AAX21_02340 [Oenococcus oeni]|nr:hypothetical protein AAX21_02340 [Oenococcus oeni]
MVPYWTFFYFLSLIGVLMVFSSSDDYSAGAFSFLIRQSIFALIGIATVFVFLFFLSRSIGLLLLSGLL